MHRESGCNYEVDPIVKLTWSKVCIRIYITSALILLLIYTVSASRRPGVRHGSLLQKPWIIAGRSALFAKNSHFVEAIREAVSRVSCDSFVFGAKCETLVTFTSLKVARAVFRQHLHTCVQKLMIRCGFEVAHVACIVRFVRFRSKVCNSRHFQVA